MKITDKTATTNTNSPVKTRFAPSPTGFMHFGNVRTALFNFLYAKHLKGQFLLRIEDTDMARSEQEYCDVLLKDLLWLGIEWQEGPFYQSERQAIYNDYYNKLQERQRVYPCFCSEEQLALNRKVQLASGLPPRYAGTCKKLSKEEVEQKKAQGIPFTLRFEVPENKKIEFNDLIKGPQQFDSGHIGDFIIQRQDRSASFMFCNAIDDALMGVTHALRGDDHLTNTPRQLLILQALDLIPPQYGHFPTILGPDSRPLSKRNGSRSIQELRQEGFLPIGIVNYLARLGHYDPDPKLLDLQNLSQHFTLEHISHSPAHYDPVQLNHWQKEAMHQSSNEECWDLIAEYVQDMQDFVPEEKRQAFVETIKPNLVMPSEARVWAEALFAKELKFEDDVEVSRVILEATASFFDMALDLLKDPSVQFSNYLPQLQQKTQRKGKSLFFPLRAALSGVLHGPELVKMMELMGVEKVNARLTAAADLAKQTAKQPL